ncbi:MAG: tRNA (pseudouridine(54)-N(1))-methyltransferase TrmY [Candidatus Aenigmarchaeota archaeon]|nr:tRNA (pseudouridine(54)-N(1))-methyltransferase TrmY [Candidatus Aenigmarchaeota archaeon]
MRTFILWSHARTDSNFNIEDLPSSGSRMDIVCRSIISALWVSYTIRKDSEIYVVLNGSPDPPKTLLFRAAELKKVTNDERSIAIWIKKVLSSPATKELKQIKDGIYLSSDSFQSLLKKLKGRPVYVFHETGTPIQQAKLEKDAVFVFGDHKGIPEKEEKFALRSGSRVSIGSESYLTSSVISVVHWILDSSGVV